jgi:hypothetical protein
MQFPLACESSRLISLELLLCVSGGILQLGSDKSLLALKTVTHV